MPRQLIYTSAPRGLVPGQSGYCTVARSRDLREALIPQLEKLSYYTPGALSNGTICAYRIIDVRGTRYQVLTRIVAAGLDFTGRSRLLAHHLVFEVSETCSPARIFLEWKGWRDDWAGEPLWIENSAEPAVPKSEEPARTLPFPLGGVWVSSNVDYRFALLQVLAQNGMAESFTNCYQAGDNPSDFALRAVWPGTAGYEAAVSNQAELLTISQLATYLAVAEEIPSTAPQTDLGIKPETIEFRPDGSVFTKAKVALLITIAATLGATAFRQFKRAGDSASHAIRQASTVALPATPSQTMPALENSFPSKPTWLVLLSTNGAGAALAIPELERIFKQLHDAEIFSKDIAARIQPNLSNPPERAKLDARLDAKVLRCIAENGFEVALHFNGTVESHSSVPVAVELAGVRLLIIPATASISLSPRWLTRAEGRDAVGLASDLENRLRQITLPAGAELALRPTVDPFVGVQQEFSLQPSTSLELLTLRAEAAKVIADKEKAIATMTTEKSDLDAAEKKVITQGPNAEVKARRERLAALALALPKAATELKSLRAKEALIPETLRGISAFSLFLCQSNVNSEIIRFTEGAAP